MTQDNWAHWRFKNKHEDLGPFGEKFWSQVFIGCGMFYVPLSTLPALNGKGPRLQGNDAILPDFDVSGRRRAYVDSKVKTKPVLFRLANELRHGIDRKCWEAYSAVSGINRQKCVLALVELFNGSDHEWSGSLLIETLGTLGNPARGFSNQDHMVYWPRRCFRDLGSLSPGELYDIAQGDLAIPGAVKDGINSILVRPDEPPLQGTMF